MKLTRVNRPAAALLLADRQHAGRCVSMFGKYWEQPVRILKAPACRPAPSPDAEQQVLFDRERGEDGPIRRDVVHPAMGDLVRT